MSNQDSNKAKILVEALPYIRRFQGQTVVIKYGGSLMYDEERKNSFATDIVLLRYVGLNPIIVHGGGKEITRWLEKIGKASEFCEGLRVTDAETMEVTEMVLSGKINSEIVSLINMKGGKAVGLSGKDANLFSARKIRSKDGKDLGFVGEVETTDTSIINTLAKDGYIPVISCIGESIDGDTLNLNADYAASAIASATNALKLIYLTDVDGLKIDGSLVSELDLLAAEKLLAHPDVQGGMKPKLECSIAAIKNKVGHVQIINGTLEHSVLLEIFTDHGVGTKIVYTRRES